MADAIDDVVEAVNFLGTHVQHAVFDRTKVPQETIDAIGSPYGIWNDPKLMSDHSAYVLAPPHSEQEKADYLKRLEELSKNPDFAVKVVVCGN